MFFFFHLRGNVNATPFISISVFQFFFLPFLTFNWFLSIYPDFGFRLFFFYLIGSLALSVLDEWREAGGTIGRAKALYQCDRSALFILPLTIVRFVPITILTPGGNIRLNRRTPTGSVSHMLAGGRKYCFFSQTLPSDLRRLTQLQGREYSAVPDRSSRASLHGPLANCTSQGVLV